MARKCRQVTNKSIWTKNSSVPVTGRRCRLGMNRLKTSGRMVVDTGKEKQVLKLTLPCPNWMGSDNNNGALLASDQCLVEGLRLSIPAPQEKKMRNYIDPMDISATTY